MEQERKAQNDSEIMRELFPFFIYAAIPIAITIIIAFTFGPSY